MHTDAHLFSVPNDCLWYDKLWGPSQRVVTLLHPIMRFEQVLLEYYDGVEIMLIRPNHPIDRVDER